MDLSSCTSPHHSTYKRSPDCKSPTIMSKVPTKIVNWVYSVLQPQYLHKEPAFNDICRFLAVYLSQGFKIRTAVFTSTLGASSLLVNLYGSLTCKNIKVPLNIWVPLNYPLANEAILLTEPNGVPLVFVVPGPDTVVRLNNNVDLQGRFYHPYLSLWHLDLVAGADMKDYNLVNLMTCLITTMNRDVPLAYAVVSSGPQLPPKPAALSPNGTGQTSPLPHRETTGPPLPQKPAVDSVPLKYRSPLPIPPQQTASEVFGSANGANVEDAVPGFAPAYQTARLPESHILPPPSRVMSPPRSFVDYSAFSPHKVAKDRQKQVLPPEPVPMAEIEDLMDKVTLDSGESQTPREILEQISENINAFLSLPDSDNANSAVAKINDNSQRILALHGQLEHHNKQALANKENLDKHVDYLLRQVSAIKSLNGELSELDKMNSPSNDEIFINTSTGQKLKLEDVITPDLKLVHQLYDVSADIKACKDTIRLLGGGFKSEEEMIHNDNLDTCIKATRGLARELFWLEVTKQNISKTMGLS